MGEGLIQRISSGWNFIRILYLVMGILVMIQSAAQKEWIGFAFGSYFASMGLFRFGCAAGNCFVPASHKQINKNTQDIQYEEIK